MDSFNHNLPVMFWREMILATILIMVTYISYIVMSQAVNPVYVLASTLVSGSSQNALDFTTLTFGIGFVLLALGLLAWGVGSAVRRGEDTARF